MLNITTNKSKITKKIFCKLSKSNSLESHKSTVMLILTTILRTILINQTRLRINN